MAQKKKQREYTQEEISGALEKLDQILRHIKLVQDACHLLGRRLIQDGDVQLGLNLIRNSFKHDNSKFYGLEWEHIATAVSDNKDIQQLVIYHHRMINDHHPEFWDGIDHMPQVSLAECVCDWYARSTEFATDLREWINKEALDRYDVSKHSKTYKSIKRYVDLLVEKPFK